MNIDREEVYHGLLRWIMSLNPGSDAPSLQWMLTGRPLAEALVILVPECFNTDWAEKTCSGIDDDSNWRVKANGLKKLLKSVQQCYNQLTGQTVSDEHTPDVLAAARDENKAEFSKLLQLILALAINGSRRQDVIEHLMKLEESVQHVVMMAIQELEERKRSGSMRAIDPHTTDGELEIKLKALQTELDSCRENVDELTRRCHELDQQVETLQDEKRTIQADNERLQQKLMAHESSADESVDKTKRLLSLQQENERLHDELFRLESARDDFKAKFENAARQNKELQAKLEGLSGNYDDYLKLKDEVDELKGKAADAKKLESTLDVYKRKLDEMNDLRMQLKIMQDKNDSYMKCAIEVDEERRRNAALKTQLEAYKRQGQDLESKLSDETKRADKMEFECQRFKEKLEALQRERDRVALERDELRQLREEIRLTQLQAANSATETETLTEGNIATATTLPGNIMDLKEQLLKLEHENHLLKSSQVGANGEDIQLLNSQLEDSNRRKQELETELRIANKKVIELEARLSDLSESQLEGGGGSTDSRFVELHRQAENFNMEAQKAKQRCFDLEKQLGEKDQRQKALETQLQSKETELKQQEAMYKSYLEKAKTVIVALEQPLGGSNVGSGYSRAEFDALRRQLQEKEKLIQRMQEDQERLRVMKEQEERLITTAFHDMALQLHKRSADERLATVGGFSPSSFLARQRQVTSKRPVQSHQVSGNR